MSNLKQATWVVLFLFVSFYLPAQQEYTLHFNRDITQSNTTNPAISFDYRISFLFPSINFNFGNNAFSFNDLIKDDANSDSTFLDVDGVLDDMSKQNIIQLQSELTAFAMYYAYREWYFNISIGEKFDVKLTYPKELVDLIWNGNAKFIGQTIDIGPGINVNYYKEMSLGIGRHLDKWDLGINVRILSGMVNVSSKRNSLTLSTGADNYEMTLSSDYEVKTAGINDPFANFLGPPKNFNNLGLALDLGAIFHFSDKLEFAQSFLDLGGIKWNDNVATYRSNGTFKYSGIDIADFIDDEALALDNLKDSLQALYFEEETGGSYWNYLSPESYTSAMYRLDDKTNLGALVHLTYFSGVQFGMSLYAGRQIMKLVNVGFSYSIKNNRYDNVGMNLNLGPKWFKIFVVTDNLFNFLNTRGGKNVTWRYGVNVNIGSRKDANKRSPVEEEEEVIENNN